MANDPLVGFLDLESVFDRRVDDVGVPEVEEAIQQSLDEHNRQLNALMSLFVTPTSEYKVSFKMTTATRNQPLDQDGRARPIQVQGKYEVAFPIQGSGQAWGANFLARRKMTVGDANDITAALLEGDTRWMRDHILAAIYANASWTFNDDEWEGHGNLTVKGPANGDTDEYLVTIGSDVGTTDDHFIAQVNAIDDANDPFETDYEELMEHPENGGQVVSLIPTNLKTSVRALADYYPLADPNVQTGANTDVLTGTLGVATPGTLFGYHDSGVFLVEWPSLPSNYIVTLCTEGERALGMRQFEEEDLRGFIKAAETIDYPFYESQYVRYAGFGAWNRVAVVVRRIGNAAYAVPTNYGSPMP